MRLTGYARVSTDKQDVSVDIQIDKITQYMKLYDHTPVHFHIDNGYSGKNMDRPALKETLLDLTTGRAAGLIVYKLDRLTRSSRDLSIMLEDYFGGDEKKKGTYSQLLSVKDHVDTSSANGRMQLRLMMTISEWERETIVERTVDALQHKKNNGEVYCKRLYGFDAVDGLLVPNNIEQENIRFIQQNRTDGHSYSYIADRLNSLGVPAPAKGEWHSTTVRNILKRK